MGELGTIDLIFDMVKHGYRLELVGPFPRRFVVKDLHRVPQLRSGMVAAVQDLVEQGAVVVVSREKYGYGN